LSRQMKNWEPGVAAVTLQFVSEAVSRPAGAGAGRVATLGHEPGDDTVEDDAVVEPFPGEEHEVVDRLGSLGGVEVDIDDAVIGADGRLVCLGEVDGQLGLGAPLFGHAAVPFVNETAEPYLARRRIRPIVVTWSIPVISRGRWPACAGRFG
jgi:hypothetical protein